MIQILPGDADKNTALLLESQLAADLARIAVLKLASWTCQGSEVAGTALVEAKALLQQVAELPDTIGAGQEPVWSNGVHAAGPMAMRGQVAGLQEFKFKTNDVVHLRGALDGERSLQISGLRALPLGKRQWLILKVLAYHAHDQPGAYLGVNEIVNALLEDPARGKAGFWADIIPEDVHKTIRLLRKEIEQAGGNPRLIESSANRAGGYRLSTPYRNVWIEDLDVE